MAELSKTARASMGKVKKEVQVETPEESIRQLRLNLNAVPPLFIGVDRVRALLNTYDLAFGLLVQTRTERDEALTKVSDLQDQIVEASHTITRLQTHLDDANVSDGDVLTATTATIQVQQEDEHHTVDFGHTTTHNESEGA